MNDGGLPTPKIELERQVMSYNIPKSEREWWALHEIERLQGRIEQLEHALKDLASRSNSHVSLYIHSIRETPYE